MTNQSRIQLELETRLESGLYVLGYELGRRIYYEEIIEGKEIDDALSGRSSDEMMKAFRERKTEKFSELFKNLTPAQILGSFHQHYESYGIKNFIFKRELETSNFKLKYEVNSKLRYDNYEEEVDRIIKEGLISLESVSLEDKRIKEREYIVLSKDKPAVVFSGDLEINTDQNGEIESYSTNQEIISKISDESKENQVFKYIIGQIISIE